MNDGRYVVSYVNSDGAASARVFGTKFSGEVMSRIRFDASYAATYSITGGSYENEIRRLVDFTDRAAASSFGEMLMLSRYQRDEITLVGSAVEKLKNDPAFKDFQNRIKGTKLARESIEFGGKRGDFTHLTLMATPFGLLDPNNIKTLNVASNELTWMVRHAQVTATYHNGAANYELYDVFDLKPDGRPGGYNFITGVLGFFYHDVMNNSAPRVHASW